MDYFAPLTDRDLYRLRAAAADPALRIGRNAVTSVGIDAVAIDRDAVTALAPETAVKLDELPVTNQGQTGRCWMFAAFNVFRHATAKSLNVKDFEFSEAHLQFHDKLERANYLLHAIAGIDVDVTDPHAALDDRTVAFLMSTAGDDGGWFPFFTNLVAKYGVMPREAFPGSHSAGHTRALNRSLGTVLRRRAVAILAARAEGDDRGVAKHITEGVRDAHRVITAHLGVPPETFTWRYRDKDGTYHSTGEVTPREFAERHVPADIGEWVALGHDPRGGRAPGTRYRATWTGNVWGEEGMVFTNAAIADLEAAAISSLDAGEPVWFACDVDRQFSRPLAVWHEGLLRTDDVYGIDTTWNREGLFASHDSLPTHAMAITGYDRDEADVRAWRIENSWGAKAREDEEEVPGKGYGPMSADWFRNNVFQVVVPRRHVPDHLLAALDSEPVDLPPYDLWA